MKKIGLVMMVVILFLLMGCESSEWSSEPNEEPEEQLSVWLIDTSVVKDSSYTYPYPAIKLPPVKEGYQRYQLHARKAGDDEFEVVDIEVSEMTPDRFSIGPGQYKVHKGTCVEFQVTASLDNKKVKSQIITWEYKENFILRAPEQNHVFTYDPHGEITLTWFSPMKTQYQWIKLIVDPNIPFLDILEIKDPRNRNRSYNLDPAQTSHTLALSDPFFKPGEYKWYVIASMPNGVGENMTGAVVAGSPQNIFILEK